MKKMHFFSVILISVFIIHYSVSMQEVKTSFESHSIACETLPGVKVTRVTPNAEAFKKTILSRRTRFIIFPKRSVVAISLAIGKSIPDGHPRGWLAVIELDTITALPDSVDGWQPTILFKRLEAEKEATAVVPNITIPPTTQAPLLEPHPETLPPITFDDPFPSHEYFHHDFFHPVEDWEHHPSYFDEEYETHSPYDSPLSEDLIRRLYSPSSHQRPVNPYKSFYPNHQKPSISDRIFQTHTKTSKFDEHYRQAQHENIHDHPQFPRKWTYSSGYRERREVFNKLEAIAKIFKFDVKSCVQRLMCELRNCLKPYGESLMEDILRIILTIPRHPERNYKFDFLNENKNIRHCATFFRKSCPYKILDYFKLPLNSRNQ